MRGFQWRLPRSVDGSGYSLVAMRGAASADKQATAATHGTIVELQSISWLCLFHQYGQTNVLPAAPSRRAASDRATKASRDCHVGGLSRSVDTLCERQAGPTDYQLAVNQLLWGLVLRNNLCLLLCVALAWWTCFKSRLLHRRNVQ